MKGIILLVLGIGLLHTASAVTHSLKYFYTASSEVPNFPEFVVVGMVDGVQMVHYDSNSQRMVPRQDWMNKAAETLPQYWESQTGILKGTQQTYKASIDIVKQRFNQSGGVHTFQNMYGCEWDDDTGATEGFFQYGYDGEDFLALDLKTKKWIAPTPQAVITKHKWDSNTANEERRKHYLTQECIEWLKKYLDYGKSTLMRTVPPSVFLLQKTPTSPVTCHATGFYPSDVMVSWQKDGQDHHEDVEYGETLPNDDGTFQKSIHLTMTPEDRKNNKYQCVVQVKGIKEDFIGVPPDQDAANVVPIIGGVVALLLVVVVVVVGVVIWKKRSKKGFVPASTSDTDSDNSGGVKKI
ncbi:H-2 class I histocompatibility antigen, Q9 alpha chain [Oncorhynchus mykiss]|uniref:MHC class I n=2 Tax=Oncorhynchus mykiss TaxID=8022 RepID=Q9TNN8_ONCMY|nr:H-2 class I histocompatibility antigen, Q9 alpha chain [Oncorhynchus mykiss]AAD53015.1 MHC class Ia heavy chain precursor [Oncorhynchus mykiss]AAG25197.1 MHC class I heavy chain precursor [Oncorhynchus mykiss]AAG25198.1 MHC class I heavy chain precursor [Oncorhynchus mykiss]ADM95868.1 MHC class IA antigen [Oncorhynchus mykiss]BAA82710.1 MHC class I [Oncorhynchus mykiss]